MKQLVFGFKLADDQTFTTFEVGRNLWIKLFFNSTWRENFRLLYLHGKGGVGKTHLLKALTNYLLEIGEEAVYLPKWRGSEQMGNAHYFLLDNFSLLPEEEEDFLVFFEKCRENGRYLLIASRHLPKLIRLADLRSRLTGELVFELLSLTEEERFSCLSKWMRARNLCVSTQVIRYLLNHCKRNMRNIFSLIDNLDEESQITKKNLTIPFIKKILTKKVDSN